MGKLSWVVWVVLGLLVGTACSSSDRCSGIEACPAVPEGGVPDASGSGGNVPGGRGSTGDGSVSLDPGEADAAPPQADAGDAGSMGPAADGGSASCGETRSDPRHCGACGHDCEGGECVGSVCQPFLFVDTGEHYVYALALGAGHVYFTTSNTETLQRVPKAGGDAELLASDQAFPAGPIVVDSERVYWALGATVGSIVACDPEACTPALVTEAESPRGLSLDANGLYFGQGGTTGVRGVDKRTGAMRFGLMDSYAYATVIAQDRVCWTGTSTGGGGVACADAADGQNLVALQATTHLGAHPIVADDAFIYWPISDNLMRAPLALGSHEPIISTAGTYLALAIHAGWLYFATGPAILASDSRFAVEKCPVDGCDEHTVVATGLLSSPQLAVDASGVYWTTADGIVKVVH